MPDEPVTFVVELGAGGRETAALYVDKLPERLTIKGSKQLLVYALRLDKLGNPSRWTTRTTAELYAEYCGAREAGKLPPSNLADPPRKTEGGQKGVARGEATWWKPKPMPRPEGWREPEARRTVGFDS